MSCVKIGEMRAQKYLALLSERGRESRDNVDAELSKYCLFILFLRGFVRAFSSHVLLVEVLGSVWEGRSSVSRA